MIIPRGFSLVISVQLCYFIVRSVNAVCMDIWHENNIGVNKYLYLYLW